MDFSFTEEQRIFADSFRKFLAREVEPLVEEAEATQTFPRHLIKRFGEMGYL
ncbi:MAG TPA: acyl-CoA dehydrogenase family protein, partial [Proteobacteria bacterium]|nr:acyl-CoA dehydrogenase family protein [Pseudomonadota bacterium]